MTKQAQKGYVLIADITGYTAYLSHSELEHAHDVLQNLLELLIEHTRPPLVISRLAGDAVISYGLRDHFLSGQSFVEMIEDTYVAFRRAIDLMVLNNTCQCSACANISNLDLKFFVHFGSFTLQRLGDHIELLGSDVNLVHRLLKNNVTRQTGFRAYTVYTDAAVRQLDLGDISQTMTPHSEKVEHLGEVTTHVQDMHAVWRAKKNEAHIEIPQDKWLAREELELPIPLHQMWDFVTTPEYRALLMESKRQEIANRQKGRVAPGSVYRCFHGDGRTTTQTILEWQPFRRMVTEDSTPVPRTTCLIELRLTPFETMAGPATRLTFTCGKARGPWLNRTICNLVGGILVKRQFRDGRNALRARLEKEIADGKQEAPQTTAASVDQTGTAFTAGLEK